MNKYITFAGFKCNISEVEIDGQKVTYYDYDSFKSKFETYIRFEIKHENPLYNYVMELHSEMFDKTKELKSKTLSGLERKFKKLIKQRIPVLLKRIKNKFEAQEKELKMLEELCQENP